MSHFADNDPQDELEYEPFDDVEWTDPDTLDAIDLDEIDAVSPDDEDAAKVHPTSKLKPVPRSPVRRRRPPVPADSTAPQPAAAPTPDDAPAAGEDETDADSPPVMAEAEIPPDTPQETGEEAPTAASPPEDAPVPADIRDQTVTAPPKEPPAPAKEPADPPAQMEHTTPAAETSQPTTPVEPVEPAEPVIPPDVYCVLLATPPEVDAQILALRATGEIATMPPPGIILSPQFHAMEMEPVHTALANWARAHLPIQIEITGIGAHVLGERQYIAAWPLEPAEEMQEAFHALRRVLAPLILPIAGTGTTIGVHIMIGDDIAPARYPHVIGHMQRDFTPHIWQTTDLQLVRQVPGSDPVQWEIVQTFD